MLRADYKEAEAAGDAEAYGLAEAYNLKRISQLKVVKEKVEVFRVACRPSTKRGCVLIEDISEVEAQVRIAIDAAMPEERQANASPVEVHSFTRKSVQLDHVKAI